MSDNIPYEEFRARVVSRLRAPGTEFKLAPVMNYRIENCTLDKPVHPLAAKMAEPTDAWQQFADKANSVTWDTLHRTQDGGYWIPPPKPVHGQWHNAYPVPNPYGGLTSDPAPALTGKALDEHIRKNILGGVLHRACEQEQGGRDYDPEQGAKVAAACAVDRGGR